MSSSTDELQNEFWRYQAFKLCFIARKVRIDGLFHMFINELANMEDCNRLLLHNQFIGNFVHVDTAIAGVRENGSTYDYGGRKCDLQLVLESNFWCLQKR